MCQIVGGKEWLEMRFVFKGNGLEKKSDKTKKDIGSLEEAIAELQN